jgi:hypothetical protein
MRFPRLTIRRLMLAVAGLAVLFGFAAWMIRMTERSNRFTRLANRHAQEFHRHRGNVESYPVLAAPLEKAGMSEADIVDFLGGIERDVRLRDYHATLKAKYERLAFYPWLSAEADPPEPE